MRSIIIMERMSLHLFSTPVRTMDNNRWITNISRSSSPSDLDVGNQKMPATDTQHVHLSTPSSPAHWVRDLWCCLKHSHSAHIDPTLFRVSYHVIVETRFVRFQRQARTYVYAAYLKNNQTTTKNNLLLCSTPRPPSLVAGAMQVVANLMINTPFVSLSM